MPRVACTSDWHLRPGDIFPKPFFAESEYYDGHPPDLVILNGDMRDFLPLGTKAWDTPEGHLTIQSLHSALEDYETVDLMGNHEGRFSWLKESNEGSHFISKREHTIKAKPLPYRFEHGHKLTEWWILRHIADDWTEWITTLPIFRLGGINSAFSEAGYLVSICTIGRATLCLSIRALLAYIGQMLLGKLNKTRSI